MCASQCSNLEFRGFPGRIHSSRAVGETLSSAQHTSGNEDNGDRSTIDEDNESDMQVSTQLSTFEVPTPAKWACLQRTYEYASRVIDILM